MVYLSCKNKYSTAIMSNIFPRTAKVQLCRAFINPGPSLPSSLFTFLPFSHLSLAKAKIGSNYVGLILDLSHEVYYAFSVGNKTLFRQKNLSLNTK